MLRLPLLAMLIGPHPSLATAQAAARRSGASPDDLRCVAGLASLLFGSQDVRLAQDLLSTAQGPEPQDRVAIAVPAKG
jgi:hypothetical protein